MRDAAAISAIIDASSAGPVRRYAITVIAISNGNRTENAAVCGMTHRTTHNATIIHPPSRGANAISRHAVTDSSANATAASPFPASPRIDRYAVSTATGSDEQASSIRVRQSASNDPGAVSAGEDSSDTDRLSMGPSV
ncbi:hypothetical protein BW13_08700 [Bifidobacterium sp. UTCIF-37]|nr:hypothetical protein BW13_08700 [Bifidobacterium sp. UTCIF-37]TPF87886.1 hypothetical protein BW11_09620 [Bifidobacterium sp. UTCIF-38]